MSRTAVVSSNAKANGTGDHVNTSALSNQYKTAGGVIGVNVSAAGNATGNHTSAIDAKTFGSVGNTSIQGTGNVASSGASSSSSSDIHGEIYGGNQTLTSSQKGTGTGPGDTSASASGDSVIKQGGQNSPYSGINNQANAGATGSLNSSSSVSANQTLTWQSIIEHLVGQAVGHGIGHAQSNVNLNGGNSENGISANGVVSGINTGNGVVSSQTDANATMKNGVHNVSESLVGSVHGSKNTSLVSASNVQSNVSGTSNTVTSFGDAKVNADGYGHASVNSNSQVNALSGTNGANAVSGSANGSNSNVNISNGLQVNNKNGDTIAMGSGQVQGTGSSASNTSLNTNTVYNNDGQASVQVSGKGDATGHNKTYAINIDTNGQLSNPNGVNNTASGGTSGVAHAETSSLKGSSHFTMTANGTDGQSTMTAQGGGVGSSSALTSANMQVNGDRKMNVQGSVSATGARSSVHSLSSLTEKNGVQSLTNFQNATSESQGSSSASASNDHCNTPHQNFIANEVCGPQCNHHHSNATDKRERKKRDEQRVYCCPKSKFTPQYETHEPPKDASMELIEKSN
ncbi:unnamed protein product [Anisakis simplex]|uniref:Autotransporter domain-containing protein n=1 Tax=Anisakis simplex TaxID=6269 RepID=A0A0M3K4Y9_ANISI|nr:unnamed protein product [Anisakis simplex]